MLATRRNIARARARARQRQVATNLGLRKVGRGLVPLAEGALAQPGVEVHDTAGRSCRYTGSELILRKRGGDELIIVAEGVDEIIAALGGVS